jgi:hypothetical protein
MMQNDVATCQEIGTELTRRCSPDVRSGLLVQRRRFGAKTLAGRLCSNIDEGLQNRETATGDQLNRLDASLATWVRDLAAASRSLSNGDVA